MIHGVVSVGHQAILQLVGRFRELGRQGELLFELVVSPIHYFRYDIRGQSLYFVLGVPQGGYELVDSPDRLPQDGVEVVFDAVVGSAFELLAYPHPTVPEFIV